MATLNLGPLGEQSPVNAVLLAIGVVTAAYVVFTISRVLLSIFVLPGTNIRSFNPPNSQSYALVTGASDGIGKEFALQLASAGYNLVLVSRTASKLEQVSRQIQQAHPSVTTKTMAIDFAGPPSEAEYAALAALIAPLAVSVLVNNVGLSHTMPVPFAETPRAELEDIIKINCLATLRVTQLVLTGGMLARRRGLIVTMGSFGGLTPTPLLATYSGSKAFLQQWSNALAAEVAPAGVHVHLVHSYMVTSAMSKIRRSSWLVPSERAFVASALAKIGRRGGSVGYTFSGSPYWSHALVAALVTGLLGVYNRILLGINKKMHVDIRRRALRKAAREKTAASSPQPEASVKGKKKVT